MSKLFTPPIIEGTDVHVTGLYWLDIGQQYDDTVVGADAPAMDIDAVDMGSEDDGEGDDDDAVQKAGDDGVNGDALDDGTLEVDLDDAAQDGHAPDNRVPILGGQEHRVFENSETRAAPCHKVG